jgi:hypothetical protein
MHVKEGQKELKREMGERKAYYVRKA